jgi:hypothetical protein
VPRQGSGSARVRSARGDPAVRGSAAVAGRRSLVAFFLLACAFSWGWWLPLASSDELVRRGDGSPTHIPGLIVWAVTLLQRSRAGLSSFGPPVTRP